MRKPSGFFSWIHGEWLFLIGAVLVIVFGVGLTREIIRRRAVVQELTDLKQEIRSLNDRRAELALLIQDFQNTTTQEREARTKLNLAKPGERALIIERSGDGSATTSDRIDASQGTPQTASHPLQWWNYFFGT